MHVTNPFLPGFHPDPSICRVGDDYYVATSTFEWYPGVLIYHSTDLVHWRLVARPLDRAELLDMRGVPDSCGVWAPCLTHADGQFWLCYTNTRRYDGNFKDTPNYLTTCASIDGQWTDPVYLNASGFDPSLFHADDGRKWLTNMVWDHRADRSFFRGIALQQYDPTEKTLEGDARLIFEGSSIGLTEGPHLYRFGDYYYLVTAEGGTSYGHAVTVARSTQIEGPYDVDPAGPVITSRHDPDWPLQRAGHGDLVQTPKGELYMVHLCSRRSAGQRISVLGREAAIQRMVFTDDGWIRTVDGDPRPRLRTDVPKLSSSPSARPPEHDDFDSPTLNPVFQWLRTPDFAAIASLTARPGFLRLYGRESPGSWFTQGLVARRQQHHRALAETRVEFEPEHFQQLAGLACYYNASKFHYLYVSRDDERGKHLAIMSCAADPSLAVSYPLAEASVPVAPDRAIRMRATIDDAELQFAWAYDDDGWQDVGPPLDMTALSDEAGLGEHTHFTGNFIAMMCSDVAGTGRHADFDYFRYRGAD
ncbi:MAG: glycoside hydrolase family 43 protein [Pseudomonadota bacterium]